MRQFATSSMNLREYVKHTTTLLILTKTNWWNLEYQKLSLDSHRLDLYQMSRVVCPKVLLALSQKINECLYIIINNIFSCAYYFVSFLVAENTIGMIFSNLLYLYTNLVVYIYISKQKHSAVWCYLNYAIRFNYTLVRSGMQ